VSIFKTFKTIFAKSGEPRVTEAELPLDTSGRLSDRRNRKRRDAREGTRALIIDDSPTIVMALKRFLRSAGYVTLEAGDAEKGIEIARAEQPELIFLDIVLPGMNGFAALRALRRDPVTKDVPIIMISGNEQATEQFFGTRIGADDFMKKPFSRFEVFARIERLLDADLVPRRTLVAPNVPKSV
jgi:twitching motility two-component system response regulator PilH